MKLPVWPQDWQLKRYVFDIRKYRRIFMVMTLILSTEWHLKSKFVSDISSYFILPQNSHTPIPLSDEQIIKVASLSNVNHFENVLDTILIPRVVGTANHEFVKQVISDVIF
jgi:hypothetical protein